MYRIAKEFSFSASHRLPGLATDHPCGRIHGHNYVITVELAAATLNAQGFVREYAELRPLRDYLDDHLDHRHLNDVLGDDCVTSEQLAKHLYDWCKARWPEISAIRVAETPKIWAEYRP